SAGRSGSGCGALGAVFRAWLLGFLARHPGQQAGAAVDHWTAGAGVRLCETGMACAKRFGAAGERVPRRRRRRAVLNMGGRRDVERDADAAHGTLDDAALRDAATQLVFGASRLDGSGLSRTTFPGLSYWQHPGVRAAGLVHPPTA